MTAQPWVRRRRGLMALSLLPMLLVLLVAVKLLSLPALTSVASDAHGSGDGAGMRGAGEKLGVANVVQPWRAPFVEGTGRSMSGDLAAGRADLERALGLTGSPQEDCTVRTNLVLTVEAQSVAAGEGGDDEARKRLADEALALIEDGPEGCLDGSDDGNDGAAGEQQRAAKERLEQQDGDPQDEQSEDEQQDPDPQDEPSPQDSPTASPEEDRKREELQERNRSGQDEADTKRRQDEAERSGGSDDVEKPW